MSISYFCVLEGLTFRSMFSLPSPGLTLILLIGLRTYLLGEGTSVKLIMPRGSTIFLLPVSFRVDSALKMDALSNSNFGNLENLMCVVHRSKTKVKV